MPRAQQKAETRTLILNKASHLCPRSGFLRTRTADVAAAAGLSHGAIFLHFPTREALFREVAATMVQDLTDRLYEAARGRASFHECLLTHVECLRPREDLYRHFVIESPLLDFDTRTMTIQSAVAEHLGKPLEREMQARRIRRAPVHLLFNTWIGLLHHYLIHKDLFTRRGSVLEACGAQLAQHFVSLISKENSQ